MLFVEALGGPVVVFHNFPLATAREMARHEAPASLESVLLNAPNRALRWPSVAPTMASRFGRSAWWMTPH